MTPFYNKEVKSCVSGVMTAKKLFDSTLYCGQLNGVGCYERDWEILTFSCGSADIRCRACSREISVDILNPEIITIK